MRTEIFSLPLATSTQVFDTLVRVIRYDEGSGTGTAKIRIKSLSGGAFDVEMVPGRQIKLPEIVRGLHISNLTASAITGKITIGSGDISDNSLVGTVTLDAATLAQLESVDLNASSLTTLKTPLVPTGSFNSASVLGALGTEEVFNAASNVNGAIILSASIRSYDSTGVSVSLLAKASAPTNMVDGMEFLGCGPHSYYSSNPMGQMRVDQPQYVPARLGLYFITYSALAGNWYNLRACRYKLL